MEKRYKKGKQVETRKEMAVIIANDLPYYMKETFRDIKTATHDVWDVEALLSGNYNHAVEIKEPKKLGRVYAHRSTGEVEVKVGADISYWQPVTINEKGEVFEVVDEE